MILSKLQLADYTGGYATVNSSVRMFSESTSRTSVFLSHKHSDRDLLLRIKRLLESSGISVYIDWLDESMPKETRGETGSILKQTKSERRYMECPEITYAIVRDTIVCYDRQ